MNDCWWGRRLFRLFLYTFFAVGTVVLAGSLSPEKLVSKPAVNPAVSVVKEMSRELPAGRQAAWDAAAGQDPVTLFRLSAAAL